ncbi:precorrin-6B methylase, partial [Butyribacter intestini]
MDNNTFSNETILAWLNFFSNGTLIDLEHVKILDITRKNKNVVPTVEAHKTTLVFTKAGDDDIFYRLWNAGLGDCEVWFNEGNVPIGKIYHKKVSDMINRGINASAGMLIINKAARNTAKIGLSNELFQKGSIHYVGSEIRSIILNKMTIAPQDNICVISGESIAIEAAMLASEGNVTAVEYSSADRNTLEDNIEHFCLHNINIVDHVDEKTMKDCPVPDVVFMVASASMDQELDYFIRVNPKVRIVIYTLD